MQIQVEHTPNSLVRKFIITGTSDKPFGPYEDLHVSYNHNLLPFGDTRTLKAAQAECPLAARLLQAGVFAISLDQGSKGAFVSIGIKGQDTHMWDKFEQATMLVLNAYLEDGKPAFTEAFKPVETQAAYHARVLSLIGEKYGEQGTKIMTPVLKAIEYMAPSIKQDGGNLKFHSFDLDTKTIFVEMTGACSGCAMTGDTLGNIQNALNTNLHLGITLRKRDASGAPGFSVAPR